MSETTSDAAATPTRTEASRVVGAPAGAVLALLGGRVVVDDLDPGRLITGCSDGTGRPPIGHRWGHRFEPGPDGDPTTPVTSSRDWSPAPPEWRGHPGP